MTNNLYTLELPDIKDLTPEQINLIENYKLLYEEVEKSIIDRQIATNAIKILTRLYDSFSPILKDKYRYWYKYQVTLIDPLIGSCTKISELITECNLENKVAINEDGQSILVPIEEDNFASTKFLELLDKELPNLKYKKIKL